MCGLLRCKEGNNVCNFPLQVSNVLAAFSVRGFGGLGGHNVPWRE